jgi:hypothetical protein
MVISQLCLQNKIGVSQYQGGPSRILDYGFQDLQNGRAHEWCQRLLSAFLGDNQRITCQHP